MAKKKKSKHKRKNSNYQTKPTRKTSILWKNIWNIIRNKDESDKEYTMLTLSTLMSIGLNTLALLLCLVGVVVPIILIIQGTAWEWKTAINWFSNILAIITTLPYCLLAFLFALILRACANEIEKENDKNYVVAVFSGLTGFVALIISLIALYK